MTEEPHETDRSTTHSDPPVDEGRPGRPNRRSAARALAAVAGGVLLVRGLRGRPEHSGATALLGAALLLGAAVDAALRPAGGRADRGTPDPSATDAEPSADASGGAEAIRADRAGTASASRSVTVGAPAEELYELWRDPEAFSRTMGHVADVTTSDGERYGWTTTGPGGREFSWETVVVDAEPGERLTWATTAATLPVAATVDLRPAPGDRGTVVTLTVTADPPGGRIGEALFDRLELIPEMLVGRALARFKSLAESGEIPTLGTNPSGRGRGDRL